MIEQANSMTVDNKDMEILAWGAEEPGGGGILDPTNAPRLASPRVVARRFSSLVEKPWSKRGNK